MLLSNFAKILSSYQPAPKREDGATHSGMSQNLYLSNTNAGDQCSNSCTGGGSGIHWAIFVGRGDTEPTLNDYNLVDKARELTWLQSSVRLGVNNVWTSVTSTFKNETSAPITIKEIALGTYLNFATDNYGVYLARSVLETPVTIGVGESYAFTYSIEI